MIDINYELYKVFYHVASTLKFFRGLQAAVHLPVGCQPVHQGTGEESWIRHSFIRSTKKVQLTPEGEILLRHIEPAMNLIQQGEKPSLWMSASTRRTDPHRSQRYHLPLLSDSLS